MDDKHPYFTQYNWLSERHDNGDDKAERAMERLCADIKGYDALHTQCIDVVKNHEQR